MHPLNGTWQANIEKSTRHHNHQFSSASMTFIVGADDVRMTYEGINASGKPEKSEQVFLVDGQPHGHPLAPDILITNSLGPRGLETSAFKNGARMGHGSYDVSEDGRTLTATVAGVDGGGKAFEQVIVFDRQA
jgi:hypothetical protein